MANHFFKFKQFTIWHDKCAMKVGTDGVLLGAWADVSHAKQILDIGTGTGLIALMLAQRSNAHITAIEIDKLAVEQAQENIEKSPWSNRIEVIESDFKTFTTNSKFDLIVSNPPYFVDSLKCPDEQRDTARHNDSLNYNDLLEGISKLLDKTGQFALIIPSDVSTFVINHAEQYHLYPTKIMNIITKPGATPRRQLIAFKFDKEECIVEELLIELSRHIYSPEYIALTKDFYLKM